jgi:hypothetical protein
MQHIPFSVHGKSHSQEKTMSILPMFILLPVEELRRRLAYVLQPLS